MAYNYNKETEYPLNIITQLGELPWQVNLLQLEENFDDILNNYFKSEKCFLNQREKEILLLRYKDKVTLEEIGKEYNITRERVRQLEAKAIKKLKSIREMFFYTFEEYLELEKTYENKRIMLTLKVGELDKLLTKANLLINNKNTTIREIEEFLEMNDAERKEALVAYTDIADLYLSVRSFNCLKRSRINTIGELSEKTVADLMKIRNLGRKCLKEIIEKLQELGIELKEE